MEEAGSLSVFRRQQCSLLNPSVPASGDGSRSDARGGGGKMASSQLPHPSVPKQSVKGPLVAKPPVPAFFLTLQIIAPAGQRVSLLQIVCSVPDVHFTTVHSDHHQSGSRTHSKENVQATCQSNIKYSKFCSAGADTVIVYWPLSEPIQKTSG